MSETTPTLALPLIQAAQAQKHVTHNEAIELLDMLTQLVVQAFDATTPPASPAEGQSWAIGTGASGDWAGQDGRIASFRGGGWLYVTPQEGWRAYGITPGAYRVYSGGIWADLGGGVASFDNLPGVGINAGADATNRLTVSSPATLFNHEGAGHQLKLNKASGSDTASLLYQSGFSGRAEMGLAGNNNFAIKVSTDGVAWTDGLTINGATGRVKIAHVLRLSPGDQPASAAAGDVYFDSTTSKARCYDGTSWHDLF